MWDVARTVLERPESMASKHYPQFLLIGDSIVQYSSFLRDGFSFGAALEERESMGVVCIAACSHTFLLALFQTILYAAEI